MDKVEKLINIWDAIPKGLTNQIDLSQKDIINHYMNIFHFGEYFYLIFDTRTANMEYVDPQIEKMLGYLPDEFTVETVLNNLHPDDLPYYYHYEQSAVRFFSNLSPELFFDYKFSYDYRLKTKNGEYKRVLQQVIPIYYFPDGGARTIAIFTDLTHLNIMGIPKLSFIGMRGAPSFYNIHLKEDFMLSKRLFTKTELEILHYMMKGMKSEEISVLLKRSIFTVRNHRKNILHKSGCHNVQELLIASVREGWV